MNLQFASGPLDLAALRADYNSLVQQINALSPGQINTQTGAINSTSAGADDPLFSYLFPPNTLVNAFPANTPNGVKGFRVAGWMKTAANGNNKTGKLLMGGTTLISSGAVALNNGVIFLEAYVIRTGVSTQKILGRAQQGTTMIAQNAVDGALDETTALTLSMTANTGTIGDAIGQALIVEAIR